MTPERKPQTPPAPQPISQPISQPATQPATGPTIEPAAAQAGLSPEARRLLADATLPAPVRQFLLSGGQLERIVLDAEGKWQHEGAPFENPALIALFNRSLRRTAGGTWVLHIPPFTYPIELGDTPYYVRSARYEDGRIILHLNDESEQPLDPATLCYVEGRGLYCRVQGAAGGAARLLRPAYFALASQIAETADGFYLELAGRHLQIPQVSWEKARADDSAGQSAAPDGDGKGGNP